MALDTKERIHDAAKYLFAVNGYTDTKVSDIIKRADSNNGSFYHHFGDKGRLGMEIFREIMKDYDNELTAICRGTDELVLNACSVRVFFDALIKNQSLSRFVRELFSSRDFHDTENMYTSLYDKYSSKQMNFKTIYLVRRLNEALAGECILCLTDDSRIFSAKEISEMYLSVLYPMFNIPKQLIKNVLDEANSLFNSLEVTSKEFRVSVTQK